MPVAYSRYIDPGRPRSKFGGMYRGRNFGLYYTGITMGAGPRLLISYMNVAGKVAGASRSGNK